MEENTSGEFNAEKLKIKRLEKQHMSFLTDRGLKYKFTLTTSRNGSKNDIGVMIHIYKTFRFLATSVFVCNATRQYESAALWWTGVFDWASKDKDVMRAIESFSAPSEKKLMSYLE